MKGIRKRLVGSYLIVIISSVLILEALIITIIRHYYYNNVEDILSSQLKVSCDFYNEYLSSNSLKDNVQDNNDIFWKKNTNGEVQVIDLNGKTLMDSIGIEQSGKLDTTDFKKAVKGEEGRWIGKTNNGEAIMAVSYPLKSDKNVVGVLRFITSLKEVNSSINKISILFIILGVMVVFISGLVSLFMSNTILEPLKEITRVAQQMASGRFNEKIEKVYDDEIGKLTDTLNYMADEIMKSENLKNEFISSISHELRTPLTSIKGWAITINSGDLDDKDEIKQGLEIIQSESDRLTALVEELLDFSKLTSGKITLKKSNTNINESLKHIVREMKPRAIRQDIELNVSYDENLPEVLVDQNRIKQVLINVIDNAFNFTPSGGKIFISAKKDGQFILITVKDTGCGISKEDLPRVTEKFYKGKSSASKNGIGLSICDELVKLHNGKLIIKSEEGKGTEVDVFIPLS